MTSTNQIINLLAKARESGKETTVLISIQEQFDQTLIESTLKLLEKRCRGLNYSRSFITRTK